ncbi:MAG: LD-carboxypeptidase [Firmicutes bacterium]|jgi:muramoyltetrapeptide carboxypeptidase LdcA involved in peptidoglycan recycling|nr:LD-carboxypeptidase [Bacillota bacterium]
MYKFDRLMPGDTIGIFSPSVGITRFCPNRFNRAKEFFKSKGFNVLEGTLTGKSDFYRSGSIKDRAEELNELIRNPKVKCIMSTIGGMNSNSLLPYIDYEAFKRNPKIVIGYSDVTAILNGIYAQTGITTFYGPAFVASFGELQPLVNETFGYFEDILCNDLSFPYEFKAPDYWTDEFIDWESQTREKKLIENRLVTVIGGKVRGKIVGGNLNTMQGIWGTKYMPEIKKGDILFIEDSLCDAATIERSFALLKISGVLDRVSGIILGKHELFKDCGSGRKPYEILLEVMKGIEIPFLAEFDCSHTHPMMTLPLGVTVELDASNKTVKIIG